MLSSMKNDLAKANRRWTGKKGWKSLLRTLPHLIDSPKGKLIQFLPCMTSQQRKTRCWPSPYPVRTQFKTLIHQLSISLRAVCLTKSRRHRSVTSPTPLLLHREPWLIPLRFHKQYQHRFWQIFPQGNFSWIFLGVTRPLSMAILDQGPSSLVWYFIGLFVGHVGGCCIWRFITRCGKWSSSLRGSQPLMLWIQQAQITRGWGS